MPRYEVTTYSRNPATEALDVVEVHDVRAETIWGAVEYVLDDMTAAHLPRPTFAWKPEDAESTDEIVGALRRWDGQVEVDWKAAVKSA